MTASRRLRLRSVEPRDRDAVIRLIDDVLRDYGDEICLAGADADLLDIPGHYAGHGGAFVVLDDGHAIRGTHATVPIASRPGVCVFRRLYLHRTLRGTGGGTRLMEWAEAWAETHAMHRVEFWSDVRFARAHAFFARRGFHRDGRTREMEDGVTPYREFFFYKDLRG